MPDPRIASFQSDADRSITHLQGELSTLQTGRASASLVEHVDVDAYGQRMQMKAVAGISIQDARTIVIQPWDRNMLQAIEKAIQQSELGVNPNNDGTVIRIALPPMTEERRTQLVKVVHRLSEEARISVRQARQKAQDAIKQDQSENVRNSLLDQLQKEVDKVNARIDELKQHKEEEMMSV